MVSDAHQNPVGGRYLPRPHTARIYSGCRRSADGLPNGDVPVVAGPPPALPLQPAAVPRLFKKGDPEPRSADYDSAAMAIWSEPNKKPYFFDQSTGTTSWTRPAGDPAFDKYFSDWTSW